MMLSIANPVLKESPNLTKNRLKVYVLNTGDISYHSVEDNLFNHGLSQFLEEEGEKYFRENGKKSHSSYTILTLNDSESMKKGIAFYEKALTLVDIQDNSAIKHIDTATLKPGKEAEFRQLIQEMYEAGLLTQKYQ